MVIEIITLIFTLFNSVILFCAGAVVLRMAKITQQKQQEAKEQEEKIKSDFAKMFGGGSSNEESED